MCISSKAIYECVATTVCPTGRINSASIGVNVKIKEGKYILKTHIYEGSDTARNILYFYKDKRNKISISFVCREDIDLVVFGALKGHASQEKEFADSEYEYSRGVPYLKRGYITAICRLLKLKRKKKSDDLGEVFIYECYFIVEKWLAGKVKYCVEPISRACGALLEAAIETTRLLPSEKFAQTERRSMIERFLSIANKTGSDYDRKIAKFILERIKEY